jgi:predicted flap endonuclease-1-like 5' DNA nuclease
VIPTFPPGEILQVFFEISEIGSPISGISGVIFINGIINGLFWGTIILIVFRLFSGPSKEKVILPTWFPGYSTSRASTSNYVPPKTHVKKPIRNVRKIRTQAPLDQKIVVIEGIGPIYGKRLRRSGIRTVDDLLREGYNRSGRKYLAREVGVSTSTVLRWVYRADFFRIAGIGKQYSSLLESTGVDSVSDLSRRNPRKLYERLKKTNWRKNLVRRIPPYCMVDNWIESAKSLESLVKS